MGGELREARTISGSLDPRIDSVEERINGVEKRVDDGGMPEFAWLGIGLALGAGLMLMLSRRSRRSPIRRESPPLDQGGSAAPTNEWDRLDDPQNGNGAAAEKANDRELEPVP